MLSHAKAVAILGKIVPHALHADSPHPINPNFYHITEYDLNNFSAEELIGHDWYDGRETHYKGAVHVIEKDKLEAYVNSDRSKLPATLNDAFKPNAKVQVGAKLRTVEDIIDTLHSFMKEDINGVQGMTVAARAVCATILRTAENKICIAAFRAFLPRKKSARYKK